MVVSEPDRALTLELGSEAATVALAQRLAPAVRGGGVLYLRGELGAGKTTFARAVLRALGVGERVKSPTYTLLERYRIDDHNAFHLDLYRIANPDELEWLGLDELDDPAVLVLVEWPERGGGALPAADLEVAIEHAGKGRNVRLTALSTRGRGWLAGLAHRHSDRTQ